MYLSQILLNPLNKGARRDIVHPYELHRTLMRAFEHEPDVRNRVLFRVEPVRRALRSEYVPVLVQSSDIYPDWSFLEDMGDYALDVPPVKEVQVQLRRGMVYAFRLVANPTKKIQGNRVPLIHPETVEREGKVYEGYYTWLERKAEQHGFGIMHAIGAPFRLGQSAHGKVSGKARIPHFGVRFDGVLVVNAPERMEEALRSGIGPAKAFGFGLLTLARLA